MEERKKHFSLGLKMYIFLVLTVITVALGTASIAYNVSAEQIDRYYKRLSEDNARNFATLVDADFLSELRTAAESEEFQQLRDRSEEAEDETPVKEYLEQHGLWENYSATRDKLDTYLRTMNDIKYLYIIVPGDVDAVLDMYLMDDDENPLYRTGYFEDREPEFYGKDLWTLDEPTISHGDWGWLCSAYAPVCLKNGDAVCLIGCDFGMEDVIDERTRFFTYIIIGTLILIVLVLAIAGFFVTRTVIEPLNALTAEMKRFKPGKQMTYADAGIVELSINSHDEIRDIYESIRSMQTNIIDHLNDLYIAESDIKAKDLQIGEISKAAYRDALTEVGSKAAYVKRVEAINKELTEGNAKFAIVMTDINGLKTINDNYGHKAGDSYIIGCSRIICDVFKHSPVYRIGGDEFVAILCGADYDNRHELVKALKNKYAETAGKEGRKPWHRYSAAVGYAERSSADMTFDLIFKRADKAMYEDKKRIKQE